MGLSAFATILLFLVCLAGGIAIGFLLDRYLKSTIEEPQAEKIEYPPAEREPVFSKPQEPALLQVGWTKKKKLWVEMEGQHWENPDDLPQENRKELTALSRELGAWVEPPPEKVSEPSVVAAPEAYEPRPAKTSIFSRSYAPWRTPKKEPTIPVKIEPATSPVSMVTQIDAILQQKLVGTPFSTLDVHLIESPTGEVNIQVGTIKHPTVDSIPNHEIQDLIRQAVAEWERITQ